MSEPQRLRYAQRDLVADYLRASFGASICLGPPLFLETTPVVTWVLTAIGAVFAVFGLRTALRHMTVYELGAAGFRALGPRSATVSWSGLSAMNLAYFSTRKARRERLKFSGTSGWMELTLRDGTQAIKVDSSLAGFDDIVHSAVAAARRQGLKLNAVTRANLAAMGFVDDAEDAG